ncbi:MAG TPA: gephyrin-like molybdotransferase Glp, partial [Anaerolineales bacterium]|nr:gephyrin-like molybdotransferase Glp [Anaerolineales bacterium]
MSGLTKLVPVDQALRSFLAAIPDPDPGSTELIRTEDALGRALAGPVIAPHSLPPFDRTTVDGYAVRAADTLGASSTHPANFSLAGEVLMGTAPQLGVDHGQAALVHTGGMIPLGADAVVMIEDTQAVNGSDIVVLKAVASGQNVIREGEDVAAGQVVIPAGVRLRPQEIGGLMALGIVQVQVRLRPRVALLSTGDEVVNPATQPAPGQIRDVNSYSLGTLVEQAGGRPIRYGIIRDSAAELEAVSRRAQAESDLIAIAAGSSVSVRDLTAGVIRTLGPPGILVHGVSMRPGKPTILAVCNQVPVVGLPGNPVSALVVAGLFLLPALRKLLGLRGPEWPSVRQARLTSKVTSAIGREDYLPVRLEVSPQGLLAAPVHGGSNMIFTLVRADG